MNVRPRWGSRLAVAVAVRTTVAVGTGAMATRIAVPQNHISLHKVSTAIIFNVFDQPC